MRSYPQVRGIVNLLSGLSSARLVCHTQRMNPPSSNRYKNHRFPVEIISHAVWLYFRFCLSYRDVEELLFVRGMIVSYEAIRKWCRKFGQQYANQLRRRRPRLGDKWHLDEVFLTMHGGWHYLWRAVDRDGHVKEAGSGAVSRPAFPASNRDTLKGLHTRPAQHDEDSRS
jgi:putative transposase